MGPQGLGLVRDPSFSSTTENGLVETCEGKNGSQIYRTQLLQNQAGIQDERDALMENIAEMERQCEETKKTLETDIENDKDALANSQTKLAAATEKAPESHA